eukprot:110078-Chlamydomonas_euryale.AAC.1
MGASLWEGVVRVRLGALTPSPLHSPPQGLGRVQAHIAACSQPPRSAHLDRLSPAFSACPAHQVPRRARAHGAACLWRPRRPGTRVRVGPRGAHAVAAVVVCVGRHFKIRGQANPPRLHGRRRRGAVHRRAWHADDAQDVPLCGRCEHERDARRAAHQGDHQCGAQDQHADHEGAGSAKWNGFGNARRALVWWCRGGCVGMPCIQRITFHNVHVKTLGRVIPPCWAGDPTKAMCMHTSQNGGIVRVFPAWVGDSTVLGG